MRLWLARKLLGRREPRELWLLPYRGGPTERDRNILVCLRAELAVRLAMEAWHRKQLLKRYQYTPSRYLLEPIEPKFLRHVHDLLFATQETPQ